MIFDQEWRKQSVRKKAFCIIDIVYCIYLVLMMFLDFFDLWEPAWYLYKLGLCVLFVVLGIKCWKDDRKASLLFWGVTLFILVGCIVLFILKNDIGN